MRQIIISAFVSLDGVMQAPGGPEEDPTGGFAHGGWTAPFWDDVIAGAMGETFSKPFDALLGRRTYDIFASHWPFVPTDPAAPGYDEGNAEMARLFNAMTKHVATHRPESLTWENTESLGPDAAGRLRELKAGDGPDLIVQGSSEVIQLLLAHDLADSLRLLIYPVVLGRGKRLFGNGTIPAAFRLAKSTASPSGVLIATYERAGEVQTGSFALENPSDAEQERRETLS